MGAGLGNHLHLVNAFRPQQRSHGSRVGNAIPRVETLEKLGSNLTNRVPKRGGRRLEPIRPPSGNCEPAFGTYNPPKLPYRGPHIRHEENAKHTNDRIELRSLNRKIEHVPKAEPDVPKPSIACFQTSQGE